MKQLPPGMEPLSHDGNVTVRIVYSIFDTLLRRDFMNPLEGGGSRLVPALAESVLPGAVIFLTTLSISLVGDWLRDRLDPTLR